MTGFKWVYSCVSSAFTAMWVSRGATECERRAPKWRPGDMDPARGHPGPGRLLLLSLHTLPFPPSLVSSAIAVIHLNRHWIVDTLWGPVAVSCLTSHRKWSIRQHTWLQLKPVSRFERSFNLSFVIYHQVRPNLHRNPCFIYVLKWLRMTVTALTTRQILSILNYEHPHLV